MKQNKIKTHIDIRQHQISVGNINMHYQVAGEGESLILIHGLSASSRWWVRNIPALTQHYLLYLLDLPGFGTMRHIHGSFVLDQVAAGIVSWMEAAGIPQSHLLGHSMGGYICLWIAAHYPERVKRLVLVSPAGLPHVRSITGYTLPLLTALRHMPLAFYSILVSDALRAGPTTILQAVQDLLTKDIRHSLPVISAPTLLIWGEHDSLVPPALGDILCQEIPHAQLLILKHAGHVAMFDQPAQFNTAVLKFLAEEQ